MNAAHDGPVFQPKLLTTLKGYGLQQLGRDALAGLIVGVVALPLAIAFGIASGVTPDRGLVTAIVAGLLVSALGGSRVQIGGPTGAFVVIVYGIVRQYGLDALIVCTLMAGVILIAMGALRLGAVIRFIPYPLTVGFTSGIAVIIFSQQIKDLLGLTTPALPGDFVGRWRVYFHCLRSAQPAAIALSALTLAVIVAWPRFNKRVPGSIVALVLATALSTALGLHVETIGSRFGALPRGLPAPHWPALPASQWRLLVGPAFTVAMLGAIESLLSATVADSMVGGRHRSNTELIGQGFANIASALFGGIPATGAIARTATNIKNGGRTPIAGMVHALTLLLIVLSFGPLARLVPLSVLAGILVLVCYHMSEWRSFRALLKAPAADRAVLLTTFLLTVFVDLTVAVAAGMALALALFVRRMTEVSDIRRVERRALPAGVTVYEAEGALFFGFAARLRESIHLGGQPPRAVILRMRHVLALDASGIRALEEFSRACRASGTRLVLAALRRQPLKALEASGTLAAPEAPSVCSDLDEALERVEREAR